MAFLAAFLLTPAALAEDPSQDIAMDSEEHAALIDTAARQACDGLRELQATNWLECMDTVHYMLEDESPAVAQTLMGNIAKCRNDGATQETLATCLRELDSRTSFGLGPVEAGILAIFALPPLVIGVHRWRSQGIFAGLGSLWIAAVGMLVLMAIVGGFLSAGFVGGLERMREMLSPFNVLHYMMVFVLCLPGIGCLWLQTKIDERRSTGSGQSTSA